MTERACRECGEVMGSGNALEGAERRIWELEARIAAALALFDPEDRAAFNPTTVAVRARLLGDPAHGLADR